MSFWGDFDHTYSFISQTTDFSANMGTDFWLKLDVFNSVCYEANALLNLSCSNLYCSVSTFSQFVRVLKKVKTGVLEALWMEILKNVNGGNGATRNEQVKQ